MARTTVIRYPQWVNGKKLLIGDVCYKKIDDDWKKFFYTGIRWVGDSYAPDSLIEKARIRQKYMVDTETMRKTGI